MDEPLGTVLTTIGQRLKNTEPIPSAAFCGECSYLLTSKLTEEQFDAIVGTRGIKPYMAVCRCPEIARQREAAKVARFFDAHLPRVGVPRTFDNFDLREGTQDGLEAVGHFVRAIGGFNICVLVGAPGSGKSHLMEAAARVCLEQGETVRLEYVPDMLQAMRGSYGGGEDLSAMLDYYNGVNVLILDDLGLEKASDWVVERLTSLVDHRYRHGGRLLVTTNTMTPDEMAEHVGDRLADRLWDVESGVVRLAHLTCGSYRTGR